MEQTIVVGALAAVPVLCTALVTLFTMLTKSWEKLSRAEVREAYLEGEILRLNGALEARAGGIDEGSATIIVDGATGTILEWPPSATYLFHWPQKTMLGKNITMLMPDRYRSLHQAAWDKWLSEKRAPRRGPIEAYARTKEGSEVPIFISLSAWQDNCRNILAAKIHLRSEDPKILKESASKDLTKP